MDDWLGQKFKAECNNVEKFVNYIKEMIEAEQTLPLGILILFNVVIHFQGLMLDGSDIVISEQDLTSSTASLSSIPQFFQVFVYKIP